MSVFPIIAIDKVGNSRRIEFTFAGEIRADVHGIGEIAADVYETRAGWKWSARFVPYVWRDHPFEAIVEDNTGVYVPGKARTQSGTTTSESDAKEEAGHWIMGQFS